MVAAQRLKNEFGTLGPLAHVQQGQWRAEADETENCTYAIALPNDP